MTTETIDARPFIPLCDLIHVAQRPYRCKAVAVAYRTQDEYRMRLIANRVDRLVGQQRRKWSLARKQVIDTQQAEYRRLRGRLVASGLFE